MASINFEKKIIYIHIPKTAGSYIQYILIRNYNAVSYNFCAFHYRNTVFSYRDYPLVSYFSRDDVLEAIGLKYEDLASYKKFTFVRNPYFRFISGWEFLVEKRFIEENKSFEELIENIDDYNGLIYNHLFVTQSQHMKGWNFDEIGQFENIEDDLTCILKEFGFEIKHFICRKNETKKKKDCSFYLNNDSFVKFINCHFDEDFKQFGYEKIQIKNV